MICCSSAKTQHWYPDCKQSKKFCLVQGYLEATVSFDTTSLAGLALGQTVLVKACRAAGIAFDQSEAHSALYDAQKTTELFCFMVNRYKALGGWPVEND